MHRTNKEMAALTKEAISTEMKKLALLASPWLTMGEACRYAQTTRTTLVELITTGHVYGIKVDDKHWIINRKCIGDYTGRHTEEQIKSDVIAPLMARIHQEIAFFTELLQDHTAPEDLRAQLEALQGMAAELMEVEKLLFGDDRWVEMGTACIYAKVGPGTMKKYIAEGKIKTEQRGKRLFVDRRSIDKFYYSKKKAAADDYDNVIPFDSIRCSRTA